MQETNSNQSIIGARLEHMGGLGFVAETREPESVTYTIGQGMRRNLSELRIVWDRGAVSWLSDGIAAPMLARAQHLPPVPADEIPARLAAAMAAQDQAQKKAIAERDEAARLESEFRAEARAHVPEWAKAAIIASLEEDDSDSMTDYFNAKTVRRVIIGFSRHCRDLFPELRKAARLFPETAALADAPADAEHREKYSMGGGYFLKKGGRYSSGWKVQKETLYSGADSLRRAEWFEAPAPISAGGSDSPISAGATIEKHTHTKRGFDMWLVILAERVERDEFERLRDAAKALGGWYSRPWGKTPGGFAFKDEATARGFAGAPDEAAAHDDAPRITTPAAAGASKGAAVAAKLRAMADGMQKEIDGKFADRLANTPKRQRQAQSARMEGEHLKRAQTAMRALADRHDAGTVPDALRGVTTKTALIDLARSEIEHKGGYYDAGRDTGKPRYDTPQALALWGLLEPASAEDRAAEELRRKIEALQFAKIPGYFPTPRAVVLQMIEAARLPDEPCSICEPSAGAGAILDCLREAAPRGPRFIWERNSTLRQILEAKGFALYGDDFTAGPESNLPPVDRVLMNPPFENGQDIDHVRRAFSMLRAGGRLVAIMSPGAFYRSDAKARAFRDWFDDLGGECNHFPAGAFKESGTDVATVLVVIDKESQK